METALRELTEGADVRTRSSRAVQPRNALGVHRVLGARTAPRRAPS